MQYKGKEIVWILNNEYFWCDLDHMEDTILMETIKISIEDFPIFLDEVKSVYITENPSAYIFFRPYTPFSEEVVTIFVYTHWGVPQRNMEKGVRRTPISKATTCHQLLRWRTTASSRPWKTSDEPFIGTRT